jgi:hypothetical protein
MRNILGLLIVALPLIVHAQTINTDDNKHLLLKHKKDQKQLQKDIDMQAISIELMSYNQTKTDSVAIHSTFDIDSIIGYVVERKYLGPEGRLLKVEMDNYKGERWIIYFRDTLVIKAIVGTIDGTIKRSFYYTKEDNELIPGVISRIQHMIPELFEFYNLLSFGKTFF